MSAEIISNISYKFRASRNKSYSYFYESGKGYNKPEHPVINKIKNGLLSKEILLPKGFVDEKAWLPICII